MKMVGCLILLLYSQFVKDEVSFRHARVGHAPFSVLKLVLPDVLGQ